MRKGEIILPWWLIMMCEDFCGIRPMITYGEWEEKYGHGIEPMVTYGEWEQRKILKVR